MPNWAVAIVSPQAERKAVESLTDAGLEFFFPRVKRTIRSHNKRFYRLEALFPNYLFIALQDAWHKIFDMQGISGLIMHENPATKQREPSTICPTVVAEIKSRCDAQGIFTPPKVPKFVAGQRVSMAAGPFYGFSGSVQEVSSERVKVSLDKLGKVDVAIADLLTA